MAEDKRLNILQRWLPSAAAKKTQDDLKKAEATLDASGVRRKELIEEKPEEKKPLEEEKAVDLGQLADEILTLAAGDPATAREQLIAVLSQLVQAAEPTPPETEVAMMSFSDETEKAIKSVVALNDGLIKSQEGLTADVSQIAATQKAISETVKTLADLPGIVKALTEQVKGMEAVLAGRPRSASKATETKLSTADDLLKQVEKQALEVDPFYGRQMKPPINGQ